MTPASLAREILPDPDARPAWRQGPVRARRPVHGAPWRQAG